jgi:prolyl oligopeptidase
MNHLSFFSLALLAGLGCACSQNSKQPNAMDITVTYPDTKTIAHQDTFHGERVDDPYRWLEADTAEDVKGWVRSQNDVTFSYLEKIPYREAIRKRLEELWDYEKYSAPFREGGVTYFFKNNGLQNHSVLYRQKENGEAEVFLDPNTFSADGTTSLAGIDFSKDGNLAAYQISEGGSDWRKVMVMDVQTRKLIGDTLRDVKFSGISWKGNEGFFYSSYDKPKEGSALSGLTQYHKLYYHRLGTPQSQDQLVFGGEKTPRRYISGYVTEDQRWLVITAAESTTGNELYIKDLSKKDGAVLPLVANFDNEHYVAWSEGDFLYIQTNLNAPNQRLVKVSAKDPRPANWKDVIPERSEPLSVSTGAGYFFAQYLKDALSLVEQVDLNGVVLRRIELPGAGTAAGFSGKKEEQTLYYTFTNYINPPTIYSVDVQNGKSTLYKRPDVKFNPDDYVSKQVFYASKDGTKIPMLITYKKGLKLNGQNPAMLYGYGGFNISLTPSFSTSSIVWLENGGVYAVPNLRGGGEYGEKWHLAGTKMNKQNVFDDFVAAAEYLIAEGYTSSEKLAISGGSNGGLLVGAVMTQRPDLVQVALPAVGVLDMLRYHKFTAGAGWAYDYGTADESPAMFSYLRGYSPYHNLKKGVDYPATLVTTGDHDDRVVPAHSFKFAAGLQEAHAGTRPVLIRIETKAGHGAGKPTAMVIEEQADKWAFTFFNMNAPLKYGLKGG